MTVIKWLLAWWRDLSTFVWAALLIAVMILTWLVCEWVAEHWWRGVVGRFLLRRQYGRMAREHAAARRTVAQSSVSSTTNNPRAVARHYRVRAGEFHGTTRLSLVAEPGTSAEQDDV